MLPTDLLVPTFAQMLQTLSNWLDKAEAQGAESILSARLAPDMFPLSTQVRFACVQVYEAVSRLSGESYPAIREELLAEGRGAGEQAGTIAEAKARIAKTRELLEGLPPGKLDHAAGTRIAHEIPNGMIFDLSADQYVRDWVLPQFYFHLMAAYAILRAQGVAIGKADYVAHMFPYIRPGTMPAT